VKRRRSRDYARHCRLASTARSQSQVAGSLVWHASFSTASLRPPSSPGDEAAE
jgi:hypothetical protein